MLAKAIYDIAKSIIIGIVAYLILDLFPKDTSLGDFLNKDISLSVLQFGLIVFFVIIATIIAYFFLNKRRFALLKRDLLTDELTGIPNHRALKQEIKRTVEWAKMADKPFSVILMDIDNFKKLNDEFNPTVADKILVKFGTLLRSDNRITDSLYRQHVKGDEFVIITRETILQNAVKAANRKRESIASTGIQIESFDAPFHLTVCCGVVEFNDKTDNEQSILERAFTAMKQAKEKLNKNATVSLI